MPGEIHRDPNEQRPVRTWKKRLVALSIPLSIALPSGGNGLLESSDHSPFKSDTSIEQAFSKEALINIHIYQLPKNYAENPQLPLNDSLRGADGGASVELPNGTRLFVFADTFKNKNLNSAQEAWAMPRNSAAIVDQKTGIVTFISGPKDERGMDTTWLTPVENDGSYYWPLSPIVTDNGRQLIIPVVKNKPSDPNGPVSYFGEFAGIDLVKFKIEPGNPYPQFDSIIELPRQDEKDNKEIYWGGATLMMKDPDTGKNYSYIYGTVINKNKDPFKVTRSVQVARVLDGNMANLSEWKFWDGEKWNGVNPNDINSLGEKEAWKKAEGTAAPLVMDKSMNNTYESISVGFSVLNVNGKVVLINKPGEFMSNQVAAAVADSPQGPFGKNQVLIEKVLPYDTDPSLQSEKGNVVSYSAYAYVDKKGRIVISVSHNLLQKQPTTEQEKNQQTVNVFEFVKNGGYNFEIYTFEKEAVLGTNN